MQNWRSTVGLILGLGAAVMAGGNNDDGAAFVSVALVGAALIIAGAIRDAKPIT